MSCSMRRLMSSAVYCGTRSTVLGITFMLPPLSLPAPVAARAKADGAPRPRFAVMSFFASFTSPLENYERASPIL